MSPANFIKWIGALALSIVILFVLTPMIIFVIVSAISKGNFDTATVDHPTVAVVEVTGVIDDSRDIVEELYRQVDNDAVTAVVLRVDSVGGAVGPSQEIYGAVKSLKDRKPIVASMGGVAASGGLYAALGASRIFCQPGTLTGSIGVMLQIPNFSKIAEVIGFDMVTLTSGELKDAGNPFRAMTDKEREFLKSTIDAAYQSFLGAVAESRGLELAQVKAFADGRVILGSQAVEYGLVDEVGGVYEAAQEALKLAGVELAHDETPRLIYPLDKLKYVRQFLGAVESIPKFLSSEMRLVYRLN